ncbi:hypothetical protein H6F89_27280 [Cyanobacteria bacterium FACHB-63]|nr:hypothetical protein [Cyanobacteria bacterium FACHB-63]
MKIGVIVLTGLGVVCAGVWGIAALVVHKNGNISSNCLSSLTFTYLYNSNQWF